MNWSDVSSAVRDELLERRDRGERIEKLAAQIGMRVSTLSRRLREHAAKKNGPKDDLGKSPEISFKESGNKARVEIDKGRIKTLEELLDAAGVDRDVWRVTDWGVKKWEVGAKAEWKDLEWEDGKISGWAKADGIQVEELYSVWAKLVRKIPKALRPTIQPVEVQVTYSAPSKPKKSGVMRRMVIADTHLGFERDMVTGKLTPFHDRIVLDLFLQVAEFIQPTGIYIVGDFFDFAMYTDRFVRSPKFEYVTQPAIIEGNWWCTQCRMACPDSEIVIHEGNHDKRMGDYILMHLKAAYGLRAADELDLPPAMSPEKLLALHKLGIEWVGDYPNDRTWLNRGLALEHGSIARKGGGVTSRGMVQDANHSTIYGHAHRKEMASRTLHGQNGQNSITAYSPGCACRIDGVVPGKSKTQDWQQGFAIIDHDDDVLFSITDVRIENGVAIWDRQKFVARDRVPDIQKDNPQYNW